jgi:4-diphosphocytidyl-2-C-methyl-D-erythritol kinase
MERDDDERRSVAEAPAKLNLSLRVLGRRDDGFHEIETLMVTLPGLADRVEIEWGGDGDGLSFECDAVGVPADESNLAVRAARVFEEETGARLDCRLRLAKRVPHGAGLGGGSSDAAAVLGVLDRWSGGRFSNIVPRMAARLGSDVPFFLGGGAAWCRGRGERTEPAAGVPALRVLLLKPWFGVGTPDAYRRWGDAVALPGVEFGPQWCAAGELVNDLERPVFAKHLFLAELKDWLRSQAEVEAALMSGSGSTMFAVLRERAEAAAIAAAARSELDPTLWWWSGWTAGGGGHKR